MDDALSTWTARPRPQRRILEGRFARLEPLDPVRHGDELFAASHAEPDRFEWLFEAPMDRHAFQAWLEKAAAMEDPLHFAVINRATGRVEGRQALMRIDPTHGVIEIGSILWGPAIARSPVTTEALYLFASEAFDHLGYRRFEWKCNALNLASRRAALRFGFAFEGIFRQHMVVKGKNRDTAWFAMTDSDWQMSRARFERWLSPDNFTSEGAQRRRLEEI